MEKFFQERGYVWTLVESGPTWIKSGLNGEISVAFEERKSRLLGFWVEFSDFMDEQAWIRNEIFGATQESLLPLLSEVLKVLEVKL